MGMKKKIVLDFAFVSSDNKKKVINFWSLPFAQTWT